MKQQVELFAPAEYWALTPAQRAVFCNGCGPAGWLSLLVPDTIWGLDISEVCDIHDFQYADGVGLEEKDAADRVLINNLVRLIMAKTKSRLLRLLRLRRAKKYYETVRMFGGIWFWEGKNDPSEMGTINI